MRCPLNDKIPQVIQIYKVDRFFKCTIHQTNNRVYDGIRKRVRVLPKMWYKTIGYLYTTRGEFINRKVG